MNITADKKSLDKKLDLFISLKIINQNESCNENDRKTENLWKSLLVVAG